MSIPRSADQLLVALGGLLLVAAAVAPSVSGEGTVAGSLLVVGALALGALARAALRSTGRDRLTWSLVFATGLIAAGVSLALPVRALSTAGISLVVLVAFGAWAASLAMRGGSWSRQTSARAALDAIWVLVATAPAWWTWIITPVLDQRAVLGEGPTRALAVAAMLSTIVIADLAANGWRLAGEARVSFFALGAGAVLAVLAARLLVEAPESSTAAFAAAAVVVTVATGRPELSTATGDADAPTRRADRWLTSLPIAAAAPALVVGADLPATWALVALAVLGFRAHQLTRGLERRVEQLGVHQLLDPDTGVANRRAVQDLHVEGEALGVCSIAIGGIRRIIEHHGRPAADELIEVVAQRLAATVRHRDVVVRLGDHEFGLILVGAESSAVVDAVARRAIEQITMPIQVDGGRIVLPASVGATHRPAGGSVRELIASADAALVDAKGRGPRTVVHT
ncbi:MAG: GGDEF domain-containing protein [Actinomycetota bacterium]